MRALVPLVAAVALFAAPAALAAQSRTAAQLTINVNFTYQGDISVSLPDGTPVGTRSGAGAPTVIPAGYYSIVLSGPGACTLVPYFLLSGPGVAISDNMAQGEEDFTEYVVDFLPNSTYTWRNGDAPGVTYTFQTSGQVVGTKAPPVVWTGPVTSKSSNKDIVGSGLTPSTRGSIKATIDAAGNLTMALNGKLVTTLHRGKYKLTVVDSSRKGGFVVQPAKQKAQTVTDAYFMGKRSATMTLTAGKWLFTSGAGKSTVAITVK